MVAWVQGAPVLDGPARRRKHDVIGYVNPKCRRCGKTPMEFQRDLASGCVPIVVVVGMGRAVARPCVTTDETEPNES